MGSAEKKPLPFFGLWAVVQKVIAIRRLSCMILVLAMEEERSEIGGMSVSQVCMVAVRNPMSGNSH
jgi:hypothetical protein